MPRFHLHIYNGSGEAADEDGLELPDLETARARAIEGIRSLIAEEVRGGRLDLRGRIDIRDGGAAVLATVPFREAVEVRLDDAE